MKSFFISPASLDAIAKYYWILSTIQSIQMAWRITIIHNCYPFFKWDFIKFFAMAIEAEACVAVDIRRFQIIHISFLLFTIVANRSPERIIDIELPVSNSVGEVIKEILIMRSTFVRMQSLSNERKKVNCWALFMFSLASIAACPNGTYQINYRKYFWIGMLERYDWTIASWLTDWMETKKQKIMLSIAVSGWITHSKIVYFFCRNTFLWPLQVGASDECSVRRNNQPAKKEKERHTHM